MVIVNDKQLKNLIVEKRTYIKDAYTKNLYIEAKDSLKGTIIFFYFRYRLNKKIQSIKIGKYPTTTLSSAREKANIFNDMLAQKIDPKEQIQDKGVKKSKTVKEIFHEWSQVFYKNNTSYNLSKRLETHIISKYEDKHINELAKNDILLVLDKLYVEGKLETIKRVFLGLKKMLMYAINKEYIENSNILTLDLKALYGSPKKQNLRAITKEERFKELLLAIENYNGSIFTKVALQISPYLFLRSTNIRNLEWSEIDFKNLKIIIPANKMKGGEDFIIPLSESVIKLFEFIKPFSFHNSKYVFPSDISKSKTMSENTLNQAIKRLGFGDEMVFHGFRTTASTLLYEFKNLHGQDSEVIELCLDHRERNNVKATYNRSLRLNDRKLLMQWWSDYVDNLKGIIWKTKIQKKCLWGGFEFFENKENREKLIKTLIIHLNSYLEAENNLQKIKILVKIYQNLQKCSRTPDLIDIEELEFNKEDIFEELFYALGGLGGMYSVEMIQSRIANFIKILGGEPKLLLERFTA